MRENLSARLSLIAKLVESGSRVCDVGTDHGYLPAFLYLSGRCQSVIATDVKQKPLLNAESNIKSLGADGVRLILCDGLGDLTRSEVDTVIIAGMGGEVISGIISRAEFLRDNSVTLILQPMTAATELRAYLAREGFAVEQEQAVFENKKVYSVMKARFCGKPYTLSPIVELIGSLKPQDEASRYYISKQQKIAEKCAFSLQNVAGKQDEYAYYSDASKRLKKILEE